MKEGTTLDIEGFDQVTGTQWFCPNCGEAVIITGSPVPGLLLNKDGSVHKHEGKAVTAGYLDDNAEGKRKAFKFADKIDGKSDTKNCPSEK